MIRRLCLISLQAAMLAHETRWQFVKD